MSSIIRTGVVVLLGLAAVLFYASTFVVSQTQQALVLQFGRVRTVANETGKNAPGLYFKWPFIENVVTLEPSDLVYVPPRETHVLVNLSDTEPAEYVVARDAPQEDSVEVPWAEGMQL